MMFDKEFYKKELSKQLKDWPEDQLEKHTAFMEAKYATVKHGSNIIHLDYYSGLLEKTEILEIESEIKSIGFELSSFDKSGVAYNNLHDYTLQLAYYINEPIVHDILIGIGTNAIWDTLKKLTFFTWQKIKSRKNLVDERSKKTLNFGLKLRIGKGAVLDLKLDGAVSEETTLAALDRVIALIKDTQLNETPKPARLYTFDPLQNKWVEIDVLAEIKKQIEIQKKKQ